MTLVLFRVAVAALALHLYLLGRGVRFWDYRHHAFEFAGLGLLMNVIPFSLLFIGQTVLGAGVESILNATTPIWTVVVAAVLTVDERITINKLVGILLGICGLVIMIGPGVLTGLGGPLWAEIAVIGATLSYAFAGILAKRFKGVPPYSNVHRSNDRIHAHHDTRGAHLRRRSCRERTSIPVYGWPFSVLAFCRPLSPISSIFRSSGRPAQQMLHSSL